MLLDLAVAPGQPQPDPAALRKRVHGLLGRALRGLPEDSRLAVESDSAAVVCFLGDPQDGLHAALHLRDQVAHHSDGKLSVRVALNVGTVEVGVDPNDQLHVNGEAIVHAAQVKERAQPNEVLVSHSYHHLLTHLNPTRAADFVAQPAGPHSFTVYAAPPSAGAPPPGPVAPRVITRPAPLLGEGPIDAAVVQQIEQRLASRIGPLASVLVRKFEKRVGSAQELREALAAAIPAPYGRQLFAAPEPSEPNEAGPDMTRQIDITPTELSMIEHTLRRFIGPLALPLVSREIERCRQFQDFIAAIAGSIDHPQQREVFLQALQRALPERQIQGLLKP